MLQPIVVLDHVCIVILTSSGGLRTGTHFREQF